MSYCSIAGRFKSDVKTKKASAVIVNARGDIRAAKRKPGMVINAHQVQQSVVNFRTFERCQSCAMGLNGPKSFGCSYSAMACSVAVEGGDFLHQSFNQATSWKC